MSEGARILAFAGSAREGSLNRQLLAVVAAGAEAAGARVTRVELRDFPLPLYDGDLEAREGLPEHAVALRALMGESDGLLLVSPEYNGSLPPLLKNTLDWCSRGPGAKPDLSPYRGKVVALAAASPGALGGLRALAHLRAILAGIGCLVLPEQVTLPGAARAFDAGGRLVDASTGERAARLGAALARMAARLRAPVQGD